VQLSADQGVGQLRSADDDGRRSPLSAFVTRMRRRGLTGGLRRFGPGDTVPLLNAPTIDRPAWPERFGCCGTPCGWA